jgi:hypothetical protein
VNPLATQMLGASASVEIQASGPQACLALGSRIGAGFAPAAKHGIDHPRGFASAGEGRSEQLMHQTRSQSAMAHQPKAVALEAAQA